MSEWWNRVYLASCEQMTAVPDASVQCCVTSPPYYGLRDYGIDGQIGLEASLAEYIARMVAVFREVRRVLRDDGTAWVNMGDSYAGSWGEQGRTGAMADRSVISARQIDARPHKSSNTGTIRDTGLKPKDLMGVPWALAKALQAPYYTGSIKSDLDRVWLAAMIDGEGCIFLHKRREGQSNGQGYARVNASDGAGLEIANTSRAIVERCLAITGRGSICEQAKDRRQVLYRWNMRSNECRAVLREVYPFLVAKKQQARLAIECPSSGEEASAAHIGLMNLHAGLSSSVDFKEPKRSDLWEPGWYLRDAIIWHKLNPMPSSVDDRCTPAYEFVFMLAKSARYYADMDAVRTPVSDSMRSHKLKVPGGWDLGDGSHGTVHREGRTAATYRHNDARISSQVSPNRMWSDDETTERIIQGGANLRNVWSIATEAYSDAHFATFPIELPSRCIRIGSPADGCCSMCGAARIGQSPSCACFAVSCASCSSVLEYIYARKASYADPMRALWVDIQASDSPAAFLLEALLAAVDRGESENYKRIRDYREGLPRVIRAESSGSAQDGIRFGASSGDGGPLGATTCADGDSAPSQRRQIGQPNRESRSASQARPRQDAEATSEVDMLSSLRRRDRALGTCPNCDSHLDLVPFKAVPATVLDCFMGSGTTAQAAEALGRRWVGYELNPEYHALIAERTRQAGLFS